MRAIRALRPRTRSIAPIWPKGQTGLSVAFDLPTQTGYDSDHPLAKGEVGKVGVPVGHLGDMRALFDGIPLDKMNTSMTINAPAAWLLALYIAVADEQGAPRAALHGTTQNDIIKEYLARGTYIFPPQAGAAPDHATRSRSRRRKCRNGIRSISAPIICRKPAPTRWRKRPSRWPRPSPCSTPRKARGAIPPEEFPKAVGRMSFFVNSGVKFITEICKLRAMARDLGRDHARSLRRRRSEASPVPLWRAGEFAGADRAAAGEQRLSYSVRHAGRDTVEECARPRGAIAGVERGARPAASVGSAMVAAPAADRRLRDRHAGISATSSTARKVIEEKVASCSPHRSARRSRASKKWAARARRKRSNI